MNNIKEWLQVNRGRKLRDSLVSEKLKIPTDKPSIIILYEGQTLMNIYYCCYKAGLQTAEQDCVYV